MLAVTSRSERVVEPTEARAADLPIAAVPLARRQAEALAAVGARAVPAGDAAGRGLAEPALWLGDDLLVSTPFLQLFLERARAAGGPVRCRVTPGAFEEFFPWLRHPALTEMEEGELRLPLYHVPAGRPFDPACPADVGACAPVSVHVPVARYEEAFSHSRLAGRTMRKPITAAYYRPVAHWTDVVLASFMVLHAESLAGRLEGTTWLDRWRRRRRDLSFVKNVRLGDGARIGPHSVVQDSVLGRDVRIDAHCGLKGCVVGEGTRVCSGTHLNYCVIGERALIHTEALSFAYVGDDAQVGSLANGDTTFDGSSVRTAVGGRRVDSGLFILGIGCGPRAKLASGLAFLPGTTIPAGIELRAGQSIGFLPPDATTEHPLYWTGQSLRTIRLAAGRDGTR